MRKTMGLRASDVLQRAQPGRVLTAFCESVPGARLELRAAAEELELLPTLVALEWDRAPALASELDEIRDALAQAALSLWPDWYITAEQRFERGPGLDRGLSDVIAEVSTAAAKPSVSWLREAWKKCERGAVPLVGRLTSAEQVRQLSRALDPRRLVFALSILSAEASAARVRGLARAAEWLAHESQAKTVLLVPGAWQSDHELDHVTYEALALPAQTTGAQGGDSPVAHRRSDDGVQVLVGPIVGRPHPASDVEKLLHARLTADRELSELFEFNQRLTALGDKRYIADVVWRQGGLVIEIDGDEHCRPLQYNQDRERDYRMYMSGYTTLRVTNDEVHVDVERVLTKIRNMVGRLKASATTAQVTHGIST
jgi:very-short-patch-repair endonuclease